MILPCKHEARVTDQVQPAINLLNNLDELHPDVLRQHGLEPVDYKGGLVFRSAVESIRGKFIASSTTGRQSFVGDILGNMISRKLISKYKQTSSSARTDFEVAIQTDYYAGIEVKGGEGNSINISDRPLWANEFCLWSHLDGAVVNQPEHGAHSIINRITNEMCRHRKHVDALFFKDLLCGTRTRPCPKYPGNEEKIGLNTAPDVFLFPVRAPTEDEPNPPVHTLDSLKLPKRILQLFGISDKNMVDHVWEVHVELKIAGGRYQRVIQVWHRGEMVDGSSSRFWVT